MAESFGGGYRIKWSSNCRWYGFIFWELTRVTDKGSKKTLTKEAIKYKRYKEQ